MYINHKVKQFRQNANFCQYRTKHSFMWIVDNFSQFSSISVDKVDNPFTSPILRTDCLTICWKIVTDTPYVILYVFLTYQFFVHYLKNHRVFRNLIFWQLFFVIIQYYKIAEVKHFNRFRNTINKGHRFFGALEYL